jgi:hypothetical protein
MEPALSSLDSRYGFAPRRHLQDRAPGPGRRAVRLLATLAAAAATLCAIGPQHAWGQAASLDQYRFPAGTPTSAAGAGSNAGGSIPTPDAGARDAAGSASHVELPGGYPLTPPVLILAIVLVGGLAARGGMALGARRRSGSLTSAPGR